MSCFLQGWFDAKSFRDEDAFPQGPTWSAGWCSAQRIKNPMIAGGNHTLIQMPPALRE
jgi:hypothetical protein